MKKQRVVRFGMTKNKIKTMIEELRRTLRKVFAYTVAPLPFLAWMLNDELNKVKVPDTLIESVKLRLFPQLRRHLKNYR